MNKTTQFLSTLLIKVSCQERQVTTVQMESAKPDRQLEYEAPEYFYLRPEVQRAFGYSRAVRLGNDTESREQYV